MKKLSKVMAIVLCLTMVFVLCACGVTDTEKFIGTWKAEVDMTDAVVEGLEDELEEAIEYFDFDEIICVMTVNYKEDGTYTMDMELTEDSVENFNTSFSEGMRVYFAEIFSAEMEAYGLTEAEYEQIFAEVNGYSIQDYLDAIIEGTMEEIDIQGVLADYSLEGKWKVEGGKLYMTEDIDDDFEADSYDIYENLTDSEFTLVEEYVNGEVDDSGICPVTFSKVS